LGYISTLSTNNGSYPIVDEVVGGLPRSRDITVCVLGNELNRLAVNATCPVRGISRHDGSTFEVAGSGCGVSREWKQQTYFDSFHGGCFIGSTTR
jgi:hypothetical protein